MWESLEIIRDRLKNAQFLVTQTVLEELGYEAAVGDAAAEAQKALTCLLEWGYKPAGVIPVGLGIAQQIGLTLRSQGILPDEEENDGLIIAEAALLGCTLLLTSDRHLLDAQEHPGLRKVLRDADVEGDGLVIGSPKTIATRFFKRH